MEPGAGYELFDHPADVGVHAWGPDVAAAFAEAARGMFAVILGRDAAESRLGDGREQRAIEVEGDDLQELLVNWLAELLYPFEADGFVPLTFAMKDCNPPRCAAELDGVRIADPAAAVGVAVKAVTYHQLRVDVSPKRVDVQVILDI